MFLFDRTVCVHWQRIRKCAWGQFDCWFVWVARAEWSGERKEEPNSVKKKNNESRLLIDNVIYWHAANRQQLTKKVDKIQRQQAAIGCVWPTNERVRLVGRRPVLRTQFGRHHTSAISTLIIRRKMRDTRGIQRPYFNRILNRHCLYISKIL